MMDSIVLVEDQSASLLPSSSNGNAHSKHTDDAVFYDFETMVSSGEEVAQKEINGVTYIPASIDQSNRKHQPAVPQQPQPQEEKDDSPEEQQEEEDSEPVFETFCSKVEAAICCTKTLKTEPKEILTGPKVPAINKTRSILSLSSEDDTAEDSELSSQQPHVIEKKKQGRWKQYWCCKGNFVTSQVVVAGPDGKPTLVKRDLDEED